MPAAGTSNSPLQAATEFVEPVDAAELAHVLAHADAAGKAVLPRGGGTKIECGNPPRGADLVLSTRKLNRVLEHAAGDMTVTVEAGCTIAELQNQLARHRQRLAIDPLWPGRATVGGVLATSDNGSLRHACGGLRDLIIGITVALPDGTLARSGGKVVKNVAGYDLPKLMVGALGTLGVITQATFRLHPLPAAARSLGFGAETVEQAGAFMLAVHDSTLAVASVQAVVTRDAPAAVAVRLEGSPEALDQSARRLGELAAACGVATTGPAEDAWLEREQLWEWQGGSGALCRVAFLPSRFAALCHAVRRSPPQWKLVAQSVGSALLWLDTEDEPAAALEALRREASSVDATLVILRCPPGAGRRVDAWGDVGDSLPLMRRLKQQFDPKGTLNPGRFVGGI